MPNPTCTFDQVLYSWSESSIFGQRGFGVVAASPGWLALLPGGDDILGPVVAYPEPGRGGAAPPPHGGFAVLRGTPVVFRRMPAGTDALNRPGNYTVQVLMGHDFAVDAGLAAGLLAGGWLESPLPVRDGQRLPLLELPKPGPRRGSAAASAPVAGAVLQGLRDQRRVVVAVPNEADGRAAVCDAIRRLPGELGSQVTFSTLESEPERSAFDVAVAVAGWETNGSSPGRALRVSASGDGVDVRSLGWGEALTTASAASLRGIPEPVTAASLGMRLEALAKLRHDPARLSPEELLNVLPSQDGQAWAGEPGSARIARGIMTGMDPALVPQFGKIAARRPAVKTLLQQVGWDSLADGSRPTAEAMLRELGESQSDIDMAVLAASPADRLSTADSGRYLRLLTERGGGIAGDAVAGKLTWDERLMAEYPQLWFASVMEGVYRGPRPTRTVLASLDAGEVGRSLTAARAAGVCDHDIAKRIWESLPVHQGDQVAYLRLVAGSRAGLGITFDRILPQRNISEGVRTDLLGECWPRLVAELELPDYLATDLEPTGGVRLSTGTVVLVVLAVIALVAAGVWVGARFFG